MSHDHKDRKLKVRPGDQALLLPLVLFFGAGLVVALYAVTQWQPVDLFEHILKFIGSELILTMLLFSLLVFVRCFVFPKWLEDALSRIGLKVVLAATIASCGITSLLFLLLLHLASK